MVDDNDENLAPDANFPRPIQSSAPDAKFAALRAQAKDQIFRARTELWGPDACFYDIAQDMPAPTSKIGMEYLGEGFRPDTSFAMLHQMCEGPLNPDPGIRPDKFKLVVAKARPRRLFEPGHVFPFTFDLSRLTSSFRRAREAMAQAIYTKYFPQACLKKSERILYLQLDAPNPELMRHYLKQIENYGYGGTHVQTTKNSCLSWPKGMA